MASVRYPLHSQSATGAFGTEFYSRGRGGTHFVYSGRGRQRRITTPRANRLTFVRFFLWLRRNFISNSALFLGGALNGPVIDFLDSLADTRNRSIPFFYRLNPPLRIFDLSWPADFQAHLLDFLFGDINERLTLPGQEWYDYAAVRFSDVNWGVMIGYIVFELEKLGYFSQPIYNENYRAFVAPFPTNPVVSPFPGPVGRPEPNDWFPRD